MRNEGTVFEYARTNPKPGMEDREFQLVNGRPQQIELRSVEGYRLQVNTPGLPLSAWDLYGTTFMSHGLATSSGTLPGSVPKTPRMDSELVPGVAHVNCIGFIT